MAKREKIERRSSDRATASYPVMLISSGQLNYTQTSNLSESGLFISDCHNLTVGRLVNLILTLPNQQVISSAGEVCFVEPKIGAGIKFLKLKPSDRQHIVQAIRSSYDETRGEKRRSLRTRRKEPRSKIAINLTLHCASTSSTRRPLRVKTEDISRRGACLITRSPFEVGKVITLTCVQEECEIQAVVKYSHPGVEGWRTGVQFLSFPKKWLIMELAVSALLAGVR
jgi:c-di-GMP-binding flagellar brake protein YcgR